MIIICVEVLANTTVAIILQYVNVSDHMYILNLTQCYMPDILQLKNFPILLSIYVLSIPLICFFFFYFLLAFFQVIFYYSTFVLLLPWR